MSTKQNEDCAFLSKMYPPPETSIGQSIISRGDDTWLLILQILVSPIFTLKLHKFSPGFCFGLVCVFSWPAVPRAVIQPQNSLDLKGS